MRSPAIISTNESEVMKLINIKALETLNIVDNRGVYSVTYTIKSKVNVRMGLSIIYSQQNKLTFNQNNLFTTK